MTVRVYNAGGVLKSQGQKGDKGDTGADGADGGGGDGSGDVVGPGSATDNAVARFDSTTGKLIQNSVGILDDSGNLSGVGNVTLSGTVDGRDVATDGTKLDGIESSATADQSDAEIETAYNNQVSIVPQAEAEAGVATTRRGWTAERVSQAIAALASGTGDVVGPGSATDDALVRFDSTTGKLIKNSAVLLDDANNLSAVANLTLTGTVDGRDVATDGTKLDGIEASATADQTDAEIETAYNNQVAIVSQVDAEAGTSTTAERWTPQRVAQAIAALETGGGGGGISAGTVFPGSPSDGDQFIRTDLDTTLFIYEATRAEWLGGTLMSFPFNRSGNFVTSAYLRAGEVSLQSSRGWQVPFDITVVGIQIYNANTGDGDIDIRTNVAAVVQNITWSSASTFADMTLDADVTGGSDKVISIYNTASGYNMSNALITVYGRRHAT